MHMSQGPKWGGVGGNKGDNFVTSFLMVLCHSLMSM